MIEFKTGDRVNLHGGSGRKPERGENYEKL